MSETPTIFSGAVTTAVRFNETCLEIPDGLEYADWEQLGAKLQRANRSLSWWLGDWLRYGESRYGQMYTQAIEETGKAYTTLAHMVWVGDRFEFCRRRQNLSFGHHKEVAALEPALADTWLNIAEAQDWSCVELRRHVKEDPKRAALEEAQKTITAEKRKSLESVCDLRVCSCAELFASGINPDVVITDPPYSTDVEDVDQFGRARPTPPQHSEGCMGALTSVSVA